MIVPQMDPFKVIRKLDSRTANLTVCNQLKFEPRTPIPVNRRGMDQLDFFASAMPDGFRLCEELISRDIERDLIALLHELPFREFEFHGYMGNRRTVSFGWRYDFTRQSLISAEPIPPFLLPLRDNAAAFAGLAAEELKQVLVSEYGPNAGIGWHRDKSVFGEIIGVSLLSPCRFRFRRRVGDKWDRAAFEAAPRSVYLLSGIARTEWEHSIPAVEALRYSVTFRTLRARSVYGKTGEGVIR